MEWHRAVVQCTQGNILSRLYNIAAQPAHSAVMYTLYTLSANRSKQQNCVLVESVVLELVRMEVPSFLSPISLNIIYALQ